MNYKNYDGKPKHWHIGNFQRHLTTEHGPHTSVNIKEDSVNQPKITSMFNQNRDKSKASSKNKTREISSKSLNIKKVGKLIGKKILEKNKNEKPNKVVKRKKVNMISSDTSDDADEDAD